MERGLGLRWMGVFFAVLISITFGFAFNSVQSNTICAAWEGAFGFDHRIIGGILTILTILIIFGGIQRIAKVSSIIVPVMALGYVALALGIVLFNIGKLPAVLELIIGNAFGWEQAIGGTVGAALMQGIKRGLFSNEAGMGSAPNVAATADVSHPVKARSYPDIRCFHRHVDHLHLYGLHHPFQRCPARRKRERRTTDATCTDQ